MEWTNRYGIPLAMDEIYLNIKQVMAYMGVARRTVYNWIEKGLVEIKRTPSGIAKSGLWTPNLERRGRLGAKSGVIITCVFLILGLGACQKSPQVTPVPPVIVIPQPPEPPPPVPPNISLEWGWLRLDDHLHIVNEMGSKWRAVGSTDFLFFQRMVQGYDMRPVMEQRRDAGVNMLRILGMFDGALGRFHVDETPAYYVQLGKMLDMLADYGLRAEVVVFADAQRAMPSNQAAHLAAVGVELNKHWNAMGELCNECAQNGINPVFFEKPPGPALWSAGSNCCGDDGFIQPPWDYITHHAARDDQWPRKAECRPIRDASGRDCIEDEPMGASETNQPGRRSNSAVDFAQAGMLFGLVTSGGTFHSDSGITSQLWSPAELDLAKAFIAGLTYPPIQAMLAPYQRGNNCGDCNAIGLMPLQQEDVHELRVFCKQVLDEYCVSIRADRAPIARDGWRIIDQPLPGLVRLTR